ncbi:MAG: hypothetical protein IJ125_07135, partial [Atopobiaceae bacterium]|nr:hypothetical protein [Atopobiaceae bacterium]
VVRGAYITPQKTIVRADRTSGIVKTGSLSGNARLDSIIDNLILTRIGTGPDALRRAYDYVKNHPYISADAPGNQDMQTWTVKFALQMYDRKGGNCYNFTALMLCTGLLVAWVMTMLSRVMAMS